MTMPPSPSISPRAQTLGWMTRPYEFLAECRADLGDVFRIDFRGHGDYVLLADPDDIHQVLAGDPSVFHAANSLLEPFLGANSLMLLEETAHRRERRLLMPHFARRRIQQYGRQILALADEIIESWEVGQEVSLRDEAEAVALGLIDRLVFGLDAQRSRHRELHDCFSAILSHRHFNIALVGQFGAKLAETRGWKELQGHLDEMDRLIHAEIAKRRGSGERGEDLMSLLMDAQTEEGETIGDDHLRDELVTLMATGHETTATGLAWTVYWVLSHPRVRRRLKRELAGLSADSRPEEVAALPYLSAVVQEALRINPIVPIIARELQEPVDLGGYRLPAGVTVAPVIYLVHRRPELYPEPDKFRPERFMEADFSHSEYLPFGGGTRRCLGMHLAMYELKLLLARIVARTELRLSDADSVRPVRRMVTIAPSGGVRARLVGCEAAETVG